ncbi:pfs domain-containing protein, partial [Aureobasidium melanogenum]
MATTQENGRTTSDEVKGENIHTATQYTIGWICALPIELAAAVKMLDEEHPRLPQDPKDDNSYRFGRIGNHNIVIGCLPHGRFGLVSAASVALQMKNSFDNLRIGLMVGIGGGVPSEETDIRLGDIVVSSPTGQHGGVVQYDLGKTRLNGEIERTGSLNSPPNALLHVVTEMIAAQEMGELQIVTYLSRLADRLPAYAGKNCSGCGGAENQVLREERDDHNPVVHYGTIASGNQVMKDAFTRDKLSHELGGVLCYEMEAAGLMNNFPCLVIRGISDYSDTHKNDGWQRYAAAVAAAYAKDLLGHLASAKVAQTETLNQLMGDLSQGMARNQILIEEVGTRLDTGLRPVQEIDEEALLDWLSPSSNFSRIHNTARNNCMLGTGEGILANPDFNRWYHYGSGLLWLHGVAGCGKTTLTSRIVDHLIDRSDSSKCARIAYWYFQFSNSNTQHATELLRSLTRQLATKPLPESMQTLWKKHGPRGSEPSSAELITLLTEIISYSSQNLYLVLDALDECPLDVRANLVTILGELLQLPETRLHILVVSRREPDIHKAISSLASYTLDVNPLLETDVENFVNSSLKHDSIQRWGSQLGDLAAKRLLSLEESGTGLQRVSRIVSSPQDFWTVYLTMQNLLIRMSFMGMHSLTGQRTSKNAIRPKNGRVAQSIRSHQYEENKEFSSSTLVDLKPTMLRSWKERPQSNENNAFNDFLIASGQTADAWLANRCDKIVDALDLLFLLENIGHPIPEALHTLLQMGLQGVHAMDSDWTLSSTWIGTSNLRTLESTFNSWIPARFPEDVMAGQEILDILIETATRLPDPPQQSPIVASKILSAFITLLDSWQPQLRYNSLMLRLMVSNKRAQSLLYDLLFHIKLAAVNEELIGAVALTPCAYEVTKFVLSTTSSNPVFVVEETAAGIYGLIYFWAASASRESVLQSLLNLVAFDCYPSVTEFGFSVRRGLGIPLPTYDSTSESEAEMFNSADPVTRNKVMFLLIDHSQISHPIQESIASLIAEFFDPEVFSALLHKLWDRVPITKRVLEAVVRNKQTNWSFFVRLILSLNAAGLPLSDEIVSLLKSDRAYDQLRWPIYQSMAVQKVSSGDRISDVFLSDFDQVARLSSTLSSQ